MSEIKRAPLIPLTSQKEADKAPKELRKTVRISVVLPESTEDTCPEYNYKDELAAAKKLGKYKEVGAPNGLSRLDEFDDDDDDVRRIARQMEEKYGTGTSLNKKKRKIRKDDYADIGMGYDESDSFIDNTDGYDEMIPQNVTTLHGGFYINSGALEFKTDDEANSDFSSSSSDEEETAKPSRKRIIESSDETDRENKTDTIDTANHIDKKRKLQNGGNGMQPSLKKKLLGQNKIYIKKRRLLDAQKKTVKELLREKREDLDMSIPENLKNDSMVEDEQKEGKKNMSISNVTDVIESVVKASTEEAKPMDDGKNKVVVNSSSDGESSHDNSTSVAKSDVKLPENLSPDIMSVIAAIKNVADKGSDGKNNFSSEVNLLILRLERKCKCLGKPSQMKVYEHLSTSLKCKPEVLIKRAKTLVLDDEQKKLKNLLSGLRLEINKIMPNLLESREKESQRILQKKYAQDTIENDDNKCLRMPKRRFQWNDVTKKLLKDILMLKKRCLLLEGKSKDVLDAQMTTFLKTEIQVLWPDGWMSMNALNKIYTTYADPKRLLNNGSSMPSTTVSSQSKTANLTTLTATTVKNLPQSFNNSNLSITPVVTAPKTSEPNGPKLHSVGNEVSVTKTCNSSETSINLSMKPSLPDTSQPCDTAPSPPPKKEVEVKLKVKPQSELLMPPPVSNHAKKDSAANFDDSVIILDGAPKNDRFSPNKAKNDDSYCQVIDLSDKNDFKAKTTELKAPPKRERSSPMMPEQLVAKHHELSITPSYAKVEHAKAKASCAGDDIQKVMENLKVLQKMSSPKKCVEQSPTSSAVSVIAVNKSFAPKTVHNENSSTMQRYDYKPSEYNTSFQDEFQKQLYSALNQFSPNSTKNYNSIDRYPHITSSGSSMVTGDKYFQNSNNNYTQSSNGHKSSTSASQTGTYSILDDMFANLLTQYGYSKEATAPKSQQK